MGSEMCIRDRAEALEHLDKLGKLECDPRQQEASPDNGEMKLNFGLQFLETGERGKAFHCLLGAVRSNPSLLAEATARLNDFKLIRLIASKRTSN